MKSFDDIVKELKGKSILVANRGIPARRICRSIRERFNANAVMTATNIDKSAPSASAAHELLLLGENPRAYLDIETIIALAKSHGVSAIHPGWGFASEDDRFPQLCKENSIIFIGSSAEAMNLLGNKVQVRKLAQTLNIPVVPGSEGSVDIPTAREVARKIGFPIMLKAEGGGGGKGIIEVHNEKDLEDAFVRASTMAQASFNNPRLFVEKFLTNIHHIEIQVIADSYGNIFAFDERDCSIQRNNQKLVEITPSPWKGMTEELRQSLKDYSIALVKAVNYESLCTVEFLVTNDGVPYMIEVNTRLQVEHGITEMRYGIDLVEEQIAIAFGSKLRFNEENTKPVSHAMQVRINCEDPQNGFTPNSGLITRYVSAGGPGIRLDSNLSAGYNFPSNYDSAGALLIAYGQDWAKIVGIMERALSEYVVGGIKTTIPFFINLLKHPKFKKAEFVTRFIDQTPELLDYSDMATESVRLAKLVADISARGYNQFVQLGEYRSKCSPRLPQFNVVTPTINEETLKKASLYPQKDREALLSYIRDSGKIHFTDTTCRDVTQSNSGNRFRLAEDKLVGPYLDNCGLFSIENGGGAHFHVALLANMTYPFSEAKQWNKFAPKTLKQLLIRSTNILGYKPMPANVMRITTEKICEDYHVIRCFDFLNHAENMRPIAEVIMDNKEILFEPAISLSYNKGFTIKHYVEAVESILNMVSKASGLTVTSVSKQIAIGLKDMAGVCPPRFINALVSQIKKTWPELVMHYHRHYTDGLFVPSVGAAAQAGAQIIDAALGASVRSYGQGDLLATAAYIEEELGLEVALNRDSVREANFVLKQIIPYYDRYAAPYFQGIDYDVVKHAMPGGATSSSQEGAMKQGYINLLPQMLEFLAGVREIVKYHDVTPGSQITWNTAFLAISSAFTRGGRKEVEKILKILKEVIKTPEDELSEEIKKDRLMIYQDCNDAFRDLLLGKFGKLPLGFPKDWVYQSAFGKDQWQKAIESRTEESPLAKLTEPDLKGEHKILHDTLHRDPTEEEFVMYLNQPGDALKTIKFRQNYGDPNNLPLDVWFEGLACGKKLQFLDGNGKPHEISIADISEPDNNGISVVRYSLDSEFLSTEVQVNDPITNNNTSGPLLAQANNPYHVGSPSTGDLWVTYVNPGEIVEKGDELFNISIMKQEKAVLAPIAGVVKKIYKTANFQDTKEMVPVKEGELIVELAEIPDSCKTCKKPVTLKNADFCPYCGARQR